MTTEASAHGLSSGHCPGDNTLAAALGGEAGVDDDVLGHLSECASCQELVAEILRDTGGDDPRYRIEGLLGMGGMGLVLRAHDAVLDRAVGLKLLWAAPSGSVEPALAEARMLARFSHPNIVTVHDAGVLPHVGTPFIAMELVAGESLRQWLTQPHGWRDVLAMFVDAACGLEAAHSRGIVHADFKPANVLLPEDGGRARVTDFGLSRPLSDDSGTSGSAAAGGTPRYAAPEQAGGKAAASSDQFAFGVALHEALWGRHPTLPGECPARGCDRVPRRLRAVVARCLRADPKQRHASMADVVAQLRAVGRRRALPLLVAGALVLAVPGAVWWVRQPDACSAAVQRRNDLWRETMQPALVAALPTDEWRRAADPAGAWVQRWVERAEISCGQDESPVVQACLEERWATLESLVPRITGVGASTSPGAAALALAQLPDVDTCRQPEAGSVRPNVTAERIAACATAIADGRARLLLGDPTGAETSLLRAIALAEESELVGLSARAHLVLAKSRWQAAKLDEAFDTFSRASELAVVAGLPDLAALAMGASAQYVAHARRDADVARRWLGQARALASRGADPMTAINLDRFEAWVLSVEGDNRAAAKVMRSVIERVERRAGSNALAQATNREDLANFLSQAGQLDEALAEVERSLELRRSVVGDEHVMLASAMHSEAGILQRSDRFDEAAAILDEIATIWSGVYGADSGAVALAKLSRADVLLDAGRLDEAADDLEAARRVFTGAGSPDASKASLSRQLQARLAVGRGEPRRAREILRGLLDGGVAHAALSAQRVALIHRELGRAELSLGNYAEAERWLRRALASDHELDGTTRGGLQFALARALRGGGVCDEASRGAADAAVQAWVAKGSGHALARAAEARRWLDGCDEPL